VFQLATFQTLSTALILLNPDTHSIQFEIHEYRIQIQLDLTRCAKIFRFLLLETHQKQTRPFAPFMNRYIRSRYNHSVNHKMFGILARLDSRMGRPKSLDPRHTQSKTRKLSRTHMTEIHSIQKHVLRQINPYSRPFKSLLK